MSITDNIVAYWKMNEASTAAGAITRADSTVNAHNLTDNNTIASAAGIIGRGASLVSANSEYFTAADSADWAFGTGDFTVSYWVKYTTLDINNNNIILGQYADANNRLVIGVRANGASDQQMLFLCVIGGVTVASYHTTDGTGGVFATGSWYHVVVRRTTTVMTVHINGSNHAWQELTAPATSSFGNIAGSVYIGQDGAGTSPVNGVVDEMGVWTRAISTGEIATLYNAGAGYWMPYPDLTILDTLTVAEPTDTPYEQITSTLSETVTMTETVTSSFAKQLWSNAVKHISSWVNQNKS